MTTKYRSVFLRLEHDGELRARVRATASGILASQALTAYGKTLDELAELCRLQRRLVEDVS